MLICAFENAIPNVSVGKMHVLLELGDHLGSTTTVLDKATGEVVEASTYQPYGDAESDYRPARWGQFREDYRFTGKEEDVEVGVQYFGKRYFSTGIARWASADPLAVHANRANLNVYAYVAGAVLRTTDPVGLDPIASVSDPNGNPGVLDSEGLAASCETPEQAVDGIEASGKEMVSFDADRVQPTVKFKQEQRFHAALAGAGNTVADQVESMANLALAGTPAGAAGLQLSLPRFENPAAKATGFIGRQLQENYEAGGALVQTAQFAASFVPIGEIASSIGAAADKLPMLSGTGANGGGTLTSFSQRWAAGDAAEGGASLLSDAALVRRGGTCTAERFANGSGVLSDAAGNLSGVSVNVGVGTVGEVAAGLRYKQVGVSTVGEVRGAGGLLTPKPTPFNPLHHELSGLSAETLEQLFTPTVRNPNLGSTP